MSQQIELGTAKVLSMIEIATRTRGKPGVMLGIIPIMMNREVEVSQTLEIGMDVILGITKRSQGHSPRVIIRTRIVQISRLMQKIRSPGCPGQEVNQLLMDGSISIILQKALVIGRIREIAIRIFETTRRGNHHKKPNLTTLILYILLMKMERVMKFQFS